VVDNYQSGAEAGLPLALELDVPHAVLSNFPGSSEDVPDYFSLLRHNVDQLIRLGE
jgi:zinc transport system substrate-binding protein